MEKLIQWLISNGATYHSKSSTHTGYYLVKNESFLISYYNIDKRCYLSIAGNEPGTGKFIYTDDAKRIKKLYTSVFGFE